MNRVRITRATPKHLEVVVNLETRLFPKEDWFSSRRILYLINNALVLVAWQNGKAIGYGVALQHKLRGGGLKGRIYSLGVIRGYRRKGIGQRLLRAMENWLRDQESEFIVLETRLGPNELFYEKRGYRVVERLLRYYGRSTGLRMRKDFRS